MNKNLILSIVAIGMIVVLFMTIKGCREAQESLNNTQGELYSVKEGFQREKKVWYDKDSLQHITIRTTQLEKESLENYVKDLAKKLSIKPKQIESRDGVTISTAISGQLVRDTIRTTDSFYKDYKFSYSDEWVELSVTQKDSMLYEFFLKTSDTLTTTSYWKRRWFLGEKRWYTDVFNTNPYNELQSIVSLRTTPKKNVKVLLAPYVGVGWNGKELVPNIGIGIVYYPLSLKIR